MINQPSDIRRAHWIVFFLEVYVIKWSIIQVIRAMRIGSFFFLKVYVIKWSTIQVIRAVRIGSFFS